MGKQHPDMIRGTLDMLVLKVLSLGPLHGWGISERTSPAVKLHWDVRSSLPLPPTGLPFVVLAGIHHHLRQNRSYFFYLTIEMFHNSNIAVVAKSLSCYYVNLA